MDQLRSGVQDQSGQHGETLSLQKNFFNLLGMVAWHLWSQLLRRLRWENHFLRAQEVEAAVSHVCSTALQPRQQSKTPS